MPSYNYQLEVKSTSSTALFKPLIILEEQILTEKVKSKKKRTIWYFDKELIEVIGNLKITMVIKGPQETPFEVTLRNLDKNQVTYSQTDRKVGDTPGVGNSVLQANVTP